MTTLYLQICKYCNEPATHRDSVPDMNVRGQSDSECGYSIVYYCTIHATVVKLTVGNTSRVELIGNSQ